MNTIRSTWIGWGTLIVAGGGAYYFAKRSINADKKSRHEADLKRRRLTESLELSSKSSTSKERHRASVPQKISPSMEASHDPAPTQYTSGLETSKSREKSKYEASEPYRARKGDRFS